MLGLIRNGTEDECHKALIQIDGATPSGTLCAVLVTQLKKNIVELKKVQRRADKVIRGRGEM